MLFLVGLTQTLWVSWSTGMRQVAGGLGDARLHHYLLEHFWQWARGAPGHGSLWSPPFFFPAHNVLAFSESQLGTAPVYLLLRWLGVDEVAAFVLWQAVLLAFGFVAAFWALRTALGVSARAASVGAYLFAFAALRLGDLSQPQLLGFGFGALAAGAVVRSLREPDGSRRWWLLAAVALVGQLYSSFYLTFFWGFAALLALPLALLDRETGRVVRRALREQWPSIALAAALCLVAALPFLAHYLDSHRVLGARDPEVVERLWLPRPMDYLTPSASSWLYASFGSDKPDESRTGLHPGWATLVLAAVGMWGGGAANRMSRRLLLLLVLGTLSWAGLSLWPAISAGLPGGDAIRAVGRVRLVELYPWAIGATLGVARLGRRGAGVAVVLALLAMAEQARVPSGSDWRARLAACTRLSERLPAACTAVLYSPEIPPGSADRRARVLAQVDGMWIGMEAGVPAVNGHSGGVPRGWEFRNPWVRSPGDETRLRLALQRLAAEVGGDSVICWLRARPPEARSTVDREPELEIVRPEVAVAANGGTTE